MRKKAAAVPASKAQIGTIYAVMREDKLTRFRVERVTTHRTSDSGSPHDYQSEIAGVFMLSHDDGKGYTTEKKAVIKPGQLLGQFEEYAELVAQRDQEKAIVKAKNDAEEKAAADLVALLYDMIGQPIPNDRYQQPISTRYDKSTVELNREGVAAVLEKLRQLVKS